MSESRENDPVVRSLEERIAANKQRLDEIFRALYGYSDLGQKGFKKETEERLEGLAREIGRAREENERTRELCETLQQERRDELAEKRGMKRVIGYTGITSVMTLLTMITLLITIWQSGVFGG